MPFVTHYDMWREMDHLMKRTKQSTSRVIEQATKTNAEILGIDHLTGTIDIGKQADLLILAKNPLNNIKSLSDIEMVMVKGNLIETSSVTRIKEVDNLLDSLWER